MDIRPIRLIRLIGLLWLSRNSMEIGISFCNSDFVNFTYESFCRLFSVWCTCTHLQAGFIRNIQGVYILLWCSLKYSVVLLSSSTMRNKIVWYYSSEPNSSRRFIWRLLFRFFQCRLLRIRNYSAIYIYWVMLRISELQE